MKKGFFKEELPMKTVQLVHNRRPHISSKLHGASGRLPHDKRPRYAEPIPPFRSDSEHDKASNWD